MLITLYKATPGILKIHKMFLENGEKLSNADKVNEIRRNNTSA